MARLLLIVLSAALAVACGGRGRWFRIQAMQCGRTTASTGSSTGSPGVTIQTLYTGLNDLEAMLALTASQLTVMDQPVVLAGPELEPVPAAQCDANSRPLSGVQGRVSSDAVNSAAAAQGWTCNMSEVAQYSTPGGFRVWRYTDPARATPAPISTPHSWLRSIS